MQFPSSREAASNFSQQNFSHSHTSTCTFLFQNLSCHYLVGHQVVQPCTCKNIFLYNSWLLLHITIQHYNIMMASLCTGQYCIRPSALLGLGQWVEQCNLTMLGYQVLFHMTSFNVLHSLLVEHMEVYERRVCVRRGTCMCVYCVHRCVFCMYVCMYVLYMGVYVCLCEQVCLWYVSMWYHSPNQGDQTKENGWEMVKSHRMYIMWVEEETPGNDTSLLAMVFC